jgi:hypothetical protein
MDLNEILNLDVISIAMEELSQQKRKQRKQKVMPQDGGEYDPDVYVEQLLTIEDPSLPQALREEKKQEIVEENNHNQVDRRYQVDTKKQVVKWLRNEDDRSRMDDTGDNPFDDGLDEEDINYMSDEAANKRALQYMMTGEYPDAEIDKLLETFGI